MSSPKRSALNCELLLGATFVACVFVLALVQVVDTDAWTHLAAGREIVQRGAMPPTEPWSYAAAEQPFQYLSWLFGTAGFLAYSWIGMPGVVLLRATIIAAAFTILLLDATWRSRQFALSVLVLTAAVLMAHHRFVFRPDIVLMFCLGYCVHALARLEREPRSHAVLGIPLVALLWGNVHGSVPVLLAPFAAFLGAAVAARLAARVGLPWPEAPSFERVPFLLGLLAVSVALSLVNPNGWEQWTYAQTMMGTDWYRDEIVELRPPRFDRQPWPFVVAPLAFVSFLAAGRAASVYRLLLLIPFAVLAFVSTRYIFLLSVVAAPVIAENLSLAARRMKLESRLRAPAALAGAGVIVVVVAGLTYGNVGPFGDPTKRPGLSANLEFTPEAALAYLDRRGIEGHVFNTFELGGYLIWRDFPRRRPFVDGRGALPPQLLEAELRARKSPVVLDQLEQRYAFSTLLLVRTTGPTIDPSVREHVRHPGWALVFWDDNHRVYLRRDGPHAGVVAQDEYKYVQPDNGFSGIRNLLREEPARSGALAELRRCLEDTKSNHARILLGYALNHIGVHDEALDLLEPVRSTLPNNYRFMAEYQIGRAHLGLGEIVKARIAFERSLDLDVNPEVHRSLAMTLLQEGKVHKALAHLEAAGEFPDAPISTHDLLAETYRTLGREAEAEASAKRASELRQESGVRAIFDQGVRAMMNDNHRAAVEAFQRVLEYDADSVVTLSNLGYAYFNLGVLDEALRYQQAALAVAPDYANAHYGVSQVLERRGDRGGAVRHLEAYLELAPSGYFARLAKQRLEALRP